MDTPIGKEPVKEIRIPWYYIVLGMLIVTIAIIFLFAGPLNTSPDQPVPASLRTGAAGK